MCANSYKDAGVDIEAGDALIKKISPMAALTQRAGQMGQIGGFGGLFDLKKEGFIDPILVSGTDGVGTKLKIAIDTNTHETIGIDLVAMCANDILVQGAQPLFFMDYFATGKLDVNIASRVISGITEGCQQAGACLLGGETAEMPDFYPKDHYDLAGFCVGAVERADLLPKQDLLAPGDMLIGLPSSGFHSNGYSLIRKILADHHISYQDSCPWDHSQTLKDILLEPTQIYVSLLKPLLDQKLMKAMIHITGGGLSENIPRIIHQDLIAQIDLSSWQLPPCFEWLKNLAQIETAEMLKTFNCGIGMVLVIDPQNRSLIEDYFQQENAQFYQIGYVSQRAEDEDQKIQFKGALSS